MVPHHCRDLSVRIDVREDPLTDFRMTLHLTALIEREGAWLFEETRWQPDLADVVDESAQVSEVALLLW